MPNYRRARMPGGTYSFTVVTYKRRPVLTMAESRRILRDVVNEVRQQHPFTIDGWVLLPDHLHCLWTLPENDRDFSKRWGLIKAGFTKRANGLFHWDDRLSDSQHKHREATIWQRRFWEHMIRDDDDFMRHMDYIHYNPVKHGLVKRVKDWPHSTFHRYVAEGVYTPEWGDVSDRQVDGNFGEPEEMVRKTHHTMLQV